MTLRTILLAGIATLLTGELGAQLPQSIIQNDRHFTPPQDPLVLSRTVWRSLPDGKHIMVRRRYEVRIAVEGDGYVVNGALLDTLVEAPPPVAMLAELERKRTDAGPFPLRLDRRGLITASNAAAGDATARANAALAGAMILNQSPQVAALRNKSLEGLNRVLASANGGGVWPVDLFNPARNRHHEVRRVPLPSGSLGEVDVSIHVEWPGLGDLPQQFERTVITRLDGSERVSREVWTFGNL